MRKRTAMRIGPGRGPEYCQLFCGGTAVVWLGGVFICQACHTRALEIARTSSSWGRY